MPSQFKRARRPTTCTILPWFPLDSDSVGRPAFRRVRRTAASRARDPLSVLEVKTPLWTSPVRTGLPISSRSTWRARGPRLEGARGLRRKRPTIVASSSVEAPAHSLQAPRVRIASPGWMAASSSPRDCIRAGCTSPCFRASSHHGTRATCVLPCWNHLPDEFQVVQSVIHQPA